MDYGTDHVRAPDGYLKVWEETHPENRYATWYTKQLAEAWKRRHQFSDDDLLRWILEFIHQEITSLSEEARLALNFDLVELAVRQSLAVHSIAGVPDIILTEPQLLDIQHQIGQGIRALMTDERDDAGLLLPSSGRWTLPTCPRRVLRVSALGHIETIIESDYLPADPVAMIVNAVADFVVRAGKHLRVCANRECCNLFVASKRQAYCSPSCSQTERTQRKRDRMQPISTEEKLWYTRQQRA